MGYAKHRKIFTDKMEKNLAEHYINLVKQHYGLSMDKVNGIYGKNASLRIC